MGGFSQVRLDTMVTVIDAARFLEDFHSFENLQVRRMALGSDDQRTIVDLLTEQVEFADVIVLNKADLASSEDLALLRGFPGKLTPRASITPAMHGAVHPRELLNTGLFDLEEARQSPEWFREDRIGEHTPETEDYGISSFVYRARRYRRAPSPKRWVGNRQARKGRKKTLARRTPAVDCSRPLRWEHPARRRLIDLQGVPRPWPRSKIAFR